MHTKASGLNPSMPQTASSVFDELDKALDETQQLIELFGARTEHVRSHVPEEAMREPTPENSHAVRMRIERIHGMNQTLRYLLDTLDL